MHETEGLILIQEKFIFSESMPEEMLPLLHEINLLAWCVKRRHARIYTPAAPSV